MISDRIDDSRRPTREHRRELGLVDETALLDGVVVAGRRGRSTSTSPEPNPPTSCFARERRLHEGDQRTLAAISAVPLAPIDVSPTMTREQVRVVAVLADV